MGTNSNGYTPEEQSDMDKVKNVKKIGTGDRSPVLNYIDYLTGRKKAPKTPLKKGSTYKVMGNSNMAMMAKKKAVAKKAKKK